MIAFFTVFFNDTLIVNIYVSIFSSLAFIKILMDFKPMEDKFIYYLEILNEINMLYFNYSMFLFTELVPNVETRYDVGYFFVAMSAAILSFNLAIVSWSMYKDALFDRKKRAAEKAWQEIEPIKDKMAEFLARRTQIKVRKAFGIELDDIGP